METIDILNRWGVDSILYAFDLHANRQSCVLSANCCYVVRKALFAFVFSPFHFFFSFAKGEFKFEKFTPITDYFKSLLIQLYCNY